MKIDLYEDGLYPCYLPCVHIDGSSDNWAVEVPDEKAKEYLAKWKAFEEFQDELEELYERK